MNFVTKVFRWECGHHWRSSLKMKEKPFPYINKGKCPDCSLFISKHNPREDIDFATLGLPELI